MSKICRSNTIEKIVRQPLNANQQKVADFRTGKACVCAVAGSGKTHSVCSRIANMVQEGTDPKKILAVTFSVKAAEEMEKRIKLLGCPIRTKTGGEGVRIGTLHSLALEIIRDDSEWKKLEVDQKSQGGIILKEIVGWKCMNWQGVDLTSVEHYIAHCRNELVDPDAATHFDERYVQAYTAYHHKMLQAGLLAFDDMLFFAVKHLRTSREVRDRWNKRYDHTIIDEFQDTNRAQLEMCLILSDGCKSYMVVGDDDQSIYQWRGAHPEFMMGFAREATLITLDINYRSTPSIINAANSVIAFNQNRIKKSAKPNSVSDTLPEFCPVTNPDEEAIVVFEKMNLQREEKKEWKDFTILYRTNAQSRAFEEVFIQKGVPYQIIGGWDFWKRKEIHDVMSYLKLSVRDDDEAALRVMNKPHRFLGAKTMEKVKTEAKSKNMGVMDIIRSMADGNYQDVRSQQILALKEFLCCVSQVRNMAKQNAEPHQILGYVIDQMGYLEWLLKDEGSDNPENSRTSNLRELQRTSMRFKTANEMIQYLDDLAKEKRKKKVDRNLVTLMSIHRSKGLEFPVVFLVGASEEILPHARNENLEEERRLFYVAITRAREKLYVSSPREIIAGGKIKELNVSRFVYEAGLAVGVQ